MAGIEIRAVLNEGWLSVWNDMRLAKRSLFGYTLLARNTTLASHGSRRIKEVLITLERWDISISSVIQFLHHIRIFLEE